MLSPQRLDVESMLHPADDGGWSALVGATTSASLALERGHLGLEVGSSDRDGADGRSRRAASENARSSGPSWAAVAEEGADPPTASHGSPGSLSSDGRLRREGAWMPAAVVVLGLKGNLFLVAVSSWRAFEDGTGNEVPRPGSASQRFSNEGMLRRKTE